MKLDTDRLRVLVGRTELKEGSYEVNELNHAEKDHDWEFAINAQFIGTSNRSKSLSISKVQFDAIKKILKSDTYKKY